MADTPFETINTYNYLGPNAFLIGRKDARKCLNTPALLLDIDAMDRNIDRMADIVNDAKFSLRPHAKCHKSVAIAKRQLKAGAIGLCCASIGEAEVMGRAGIADLLITSPLTTDAKVSRLCALAEQIGDLKVVVDNPDNVQRLSQAAVATNVVLNVLVDIDPGMQRTGAPDNVASIKLAQLVNASPHLVFSGLQCYAGHIQHLADYNQRRELSLTIMKKVAVIRDTLCEQGLNPAIITGGGTGTFDIDGESRVLTELQAGSYVFMDTQYNSLWHYKNSPPPFETSLFVQASVTSSNQQGSATTDAGLKQFAVDGGRPELLKGVPEGSIYHYAGDEHGIIELPNSNDQLAPGTRVECVTPHCDPTVNLYNVIHCFRGDKLVDIWPIDARGA